MNWFKELHLSLKFLIIGTALFIGLLSLIIPVFVGSAVIAGITDAFSDDSEKREIVVDEEKEKQKDAKEKDIKQEMKKDNPDTEKPKEKKETKKKKDSLKEKSIKLDDKILFGEMIVVFNDAKVYGEDGKEYIDISFNWINQSSKGKQMFMSLMALDVQQDDKLLNDTEDAWDVYKQNSSPVYFPNAEGGEYEIDLTYELDSSKDIEITFVPLNEYDDSETIKIKLD